LDLWPLSLTSGWPWQSDSCTAGDTEGRPRTKLMPNMRSLSLMINAEPVSGSVLSECTNLTSFTWTGCGINTAHIKAQTEAMLELLKRMKTLERIELRSSPIVSDYQWCQVIEALPRLRALDALSTGFGPLACRTVVKRESEYRRNRAKNGKSADGTRQLDGSPAFEELGLQHCKDITSREMFSLLWFCNHLKILRGTTLDERAMAHNVVRGLFGSISNPEDWVWPSSRTLQHLELDVKPNPLPSDQLEEPLIELWSPVPSLVISESLDETSEARERTTPSLIVLPEEISDPKIESTLLRHQFMSLSSLKSLKTNHWTLAQVYRTSADNTKNDWTEQRPNPQLRSVEIERWTNAPRHDIVSQDPLIKDWLPRAVPSLRRITCLKRPVWEWEPPSFHDGLPFNSRPFV